MNDNRSASGQESIPDPLVPHLLELVDAPGADASVLHTFLGKHHGGWKAGFPAAEAFVFPSERLARRYAIALLVLQGVAFLPVPAPGRSSPIARVGVRACRRCGCTHDFACPNACAWSAPDLCSECTKPEPPSSWVLYQHPTDHPEHCVARRTVGGTPTTDLLKASSLDALRALLPAGLVVVPRSAGDAAAIVETWI